MIDVKVRQTIGVITNALKKFNVRTIGEAAKTIVFAHGYGCDQNMWRHVAPSFAEKYRVVLFDFIGAGGSDSSSYSTKRYSSLQAYADDLIEICTELELEDAVFVGHSVSAMIGLLASKKRPSLFSDLILVGPSPCYINHEDYVGGFEREDIDDLLNSLNSNYLGWSAAMAPVIMGNSTRPELGEELKNSFCRMDPEIAKNFARATFLSDNRKDLEGLSARVLIVQCSEDIIAPLEVGEYLRDKIPGSKFVQMKATGHCPNLSAPEETMTIIRDYLEQNL